MNAYFDPDTVLPQPPENQAPGQIPAADPTQEPTAAPADAGFPPVPETGERAEEQTDAPEEQTEAPEEQPEPEKPAAQPESAGELPIEEAPVAQPEGAGELPAEEPAAQPESAGELPAEEAPAGQPESDEDLPVEEKPAGPDYLDMTIQSCVKPLDMRFSQINGCYRKVPIAYRTHTYVNSVIEGVIPPEKYSYAADETDRGVRLSKWNISEAIRSIKEFIFAGRKVEFVTARVSPRLVREVDFYGFLQEILRENDFDIPSKLCLEFPRSIVYEDPEQARMALLAMKLLKVKSMMAGCGEKDVPLTVLLHLPFDYLLLAPWLTVYVDDRNKKTSMEELLGFLRSLGSEIIGEGVKTDDQISVLNRCDCFGYIPSPGYIGEVEHGRLRMPLEEALAQKEEEEF